MSAPRRTSVRVGGQDGAVDKALTVLEVVVERAPRASLAEIAVQAGFAKPNAHRILQALVRRGYARTDGRGSYEPGPQVLALAGHVLASLDYASHARPALLALQERVPETVHFGVLSGDGIFYVEKLEAKGAYRMASAVGMQLPAHSTAIGKAILAALPVEERTALLGRRELTQRTPRTITTRFALETELAEIARAGWAFDDEENELGVRCVGAPVFGPAGRVVGAVSLSMPAFQLSSDFARRVAAEVIDAGAAVSRSLGAPADVVDRCENRARELRECASDPAPERNAR